MLDLDAGIYAPYLWPAFAITGLVLGWMIVDSLLAARRARQAARARGLEDDWS
ncbi:MAG: heme exporter protein CcmD [Caulobacter sp.]|nr:heme exporter protein CcmD [Caulobacter sp.]